MIGQHATAVALLAAALSMVGAAPAPKEKSPDPVAPDFRLESLDGHTVRLSDLRGKAVLLSFWAPWCVPCRVETPWLVELDRQYRAQGLEIVAIALDANSKVELARFAKENDVRYTILLGTSAVADAYGGVELLPETFFISRGGTIVRSRAGVGDRGELERDVKRLVGGGVERKDR